ncbi:MAG: DUF4129 domain-containing protein [Spirochaetales bacterium]|nr:DUF4129 domain-containing protein [Spirochaetales bacterium]
MSRDIFSRKPGFCASGIYSVFSILIPFLLLVSINSILPHIIPSLSLLPWWFILIALAANSIVSRVLVLVTRKHDGYASLLRIHFFIYFPAVSIVVFVLYKTPLLIVYACILLFIQWMITFSLFNGFKDYMEFIILIKNYPGQSLVAEIHNHSLVIQNSYESLKKIKRIVHVLQLVLFLFITILFLNRVRLSLFSLIASSGSIVTGLIFGITVNTCLDEYRFYVEGLSVGKKLKQKRLVYVLLILLSGFLFVLPVLQNNSLFSPVDILHAFEWFTHLCPENKVDFNINDDFYRQDQEDWSQFFEFLREDQKKTPVFDMAIFLKIAGMIIGILLATGLLYFLCKPLLSKGFGGLLKGKKPLKIIIKQLKRFVLLLKKFTGEVVQTILSFFRPFKKTGKHFHFEEKKPDSGIKTKRMSFIKRIQKNRVLKTFFVLIKWGMKQKITFHPSLGPREYVRFIIQRIPEKKNTLEFIADAFEEAVFSDHIMKALTIKKYIHAVKAVIRL